MILTYRYRTLPMYQLHSLYLMDDLYVDSIIWGLSATFLVLTAKNIITMYRVP